jgi:hypothetical protein
MMMPVKLALEYTHSYKAFIDLGKGAVEPFSFGLFCHFIEINYLKMISIFHIEFLFVG